jgi:hypothetical protein
VSRPARLTPVIAVGLAAAVALVLPARLGSANAKGVSHPPPPDQWGELQIVNGRAIFTLGPADSKTRRVEGSLIGDIGVPAGTSVADDAKGKGEAHALDFRGDTRCLFHAQGWGANVIVTTCPPPAAGRDAQMWIRAENLMARPRVVVIDFAKGGGA